MDIFFDQRLSANAFHYKTSLERIIEKYSKLQYHDALQEVDLYNTEAHTLECYMELSKIKLNKLDSKSIEELREESISSQDITGTSQLDFTHQDGRAAASCSVIHMSVEDDGVASNEATQLSTVSSDESQRNISFTDFQPEDQDEELDMTLRNLGSSLVELYPSMISRLGQACRRQQVSKAADSVLRRYHRWRKQSNRSNLNNTFNVPLMYTHRKPKNMTDQMLLEENTNSPVKKKFMVAEPTHRSPLKIVNKIQALEVQQQSPRRERREHPMVTMDFGPYKTLMQTESCMNETFAVSEASQLEELPSIYTVSPSRPCYPAARASLDASLRSGRYSLSTLPLQTDGCSVYASDPPSVKERLDIYGSPVRKSSFEARMVTDLRSPQAFSRSPRAHAVESFSREPTRPRLLSTSPQKPTVLLRMLHPQDSHLSPHQQLRSPQSASAGESRHRLQRNLSYDSSLPLLRAPCSPKKLDEDFLKLYHKFVCQNKSSFFNGISCRLCERSSEASKSSSSSALAALALSPHRSVLRKRHRELNWDSEPQSKRYRDEFCPSSPGSARHGKELLRRRLALYEYEQSHDGVSDSAAKPSMFQRFNTQQRSAEAHQETWMSRHRHVSAADLYDMENGVEKGLLRPANRRKKTIF
ncbi:hypothetical protein CgunFtcFv8_027048 [Champsocephalus gunnari]|uniref:Uncharacterized protein n=1 Tax=Champsocephalus gunnari TaxID=52237 RepID=A0AAN8E1P7_CHAGU|nr:hypothetical protein CgunFtcFv8_027048 [Champsocephalus gunnari]